MGSQMVGHDWVTELNWNFQRHLQQCAWFYHLLSIRHSRSSRVRLQKAEAGGLIVNYIILTYQSRPPGGSDSKESACNAQVWSLGWEDPLEKGMAAPCSSLAWRIPCTEKPGGLQLSTMIIHAFYIFVNLLNQGKCLIYSEFEIQWLNRIESNPRLKIHNRVNNPIILQKHIQCLLCIKYSARPRDMNGHQRKRFKNMTMIC